MKKPWKLVLPLAAAVALGTHAAKWMDYLVFMLLA